MIRTLITAFVVPSILSAQAGGAATQSATSSLPVWKIDVSHSELSFSIRHLLSRVRGQFGAWSGSIIADPADWSTASAEVTAQATSIDTNNERRDADLRSPDHFDVLVHPQITFKTTKITRLAGDSLLAAGDLTMRGITRPVVFRGQFTGIMGVPGKRRAGFSAVAVINRKDFNMLWNRAVEGGNLIGDDVRIEMNIAAVEQAPAK